jgi:large subunit ribosomal protein L4
MPEITLYNQEGKELGPLSLSDAVFGVEPNAALIHQAVQTEEANQRQGNADTKTRGEIRGGGRKPWRQKGTGRARQGSTRSPQWRHGGVVWGPQPRSYNKSFPKKMKQSALRSALSAKVADGEVIGLEALAVSGISTKIVAGVLSALPLTRDVNVKNRQGDELLRSTKQKQYKVLVIVPEYDEVLLKSLRNIPNVTLRYAPEFSVRDIVSAGRVVLAQGAVSKIEEVLAK